MKREGDNVCHRSFWTDPLNRLQDKLQEWHYQFRFRRNLVPGPGFEPMLDVQGRTYWLKQSESWIGTLAVWRLFYRVDQVGEANGLRFGDEDNFDVGDLDIDPTHQGRHLGSVLLSRIKAAAQ